MHVSWVAVSPRTCPRGAAFQPPHQSPDPSVLPTLSLSGSCQLFLKKPAVPWLLRPLVLLEKARPALCYL